MLTNYKSCNEKKYLQFTDFVKSSKNVCKSTIYKRFYRNWTSDIKCL